MHPLRGYLSEKGLTVEDFAAHLRKVCRGRATSAAYLNQIMYGHRHPSRGLAKAIAKATEGAVTAAALLVFEPATRQAS